MRRIALTVLCAGFSLVLQRGALADGVILNGVSPYTIGRGGTNVAYADNGTMLHDNPAAMALMDADSMLDVGVTGLLTDFHYTDPDNARRAQHQLYPLPEFSYIRRASDEMSFGIGAFSPAGFGSVWTLEGPAPFTGPQKYKSFGSLAKLLAGASFMADERLSIGATIGPALGIAHLEGPYTLQGPSGFAGLPTLLNIDANGVALVWSAGAMYQLTDTTTLGLTYTSDSRIHARGDADVVTPLGTTKYEDTAVQITWPQSVALGVRQKIAERHTLGADVYWYDWKSAFDTIDINLNSSTNVNFPPVFEQYPVHWGDSLSTRIGYEYQLGGGRVLRAGYVYQRNPSPPSTMTPYIPGALVNSFSLGYGWWWNDLNINLGYMYTYGPTVTETTSQFIGGDFDNSTHHDQTHAAGISFTYVLGGKHGANCGDCIR